MPREVILRGLTRACAQAFRSLGIVVWLSLTVFATSSLTPLHAEPTHTSPAPTAIMAGDDIFQHLAEGSGLTSQVISSFAEANDGFLWIGSQGGLQRWDGYRLWTYKTQLGNPTSLPDNLTQVLHRDPSGTLWVGTSSGGLASYDQHHDNFIRYQKSVNGPAPVNVLAIEDDGQGNLWVGSGSGLDRFDTSTATYSHMRAANSAGSSIDTGSVLALLRSTDGTLWIGTNQGLLRSPAGPEQGHLVERVKLAESRQDAVAIDSLFADSSGTLWVGTDHGIYLLERAVSKDQAGGSSPAPFIEATTAYRLPADRSLPSSLFTSHIVTIRPDNDGNLWIGTQDQGIFIVTPATWAVRHVGHDSTQPTSLSDDWIEGIFLDSQGIMWIGTRHGVNYIDTTHRAIATFLGGDSPNVALRHPEVYSVFPRRDGSIWLGYSKHGIDILSPSGRRIAQLPNATGTSPAETAHALPAGTMGAIRESANGGVYIITQHGLYLAENADIPNVNAPDAPARAARFFHPRLTRLPIGAEAAQGLFQVLPDHDSRGHEFLWLGGTNGLWTFDPSGSGPAVPAHLKKPLTDPRIRVLLRGTGDVMWVGTLNGLNRLNTATGDVDNIPADEANPQGLGAGMISTLLIDRKGRLWVGTFTGGIDLLQGIDAQGRARFHRIVDGLPNDNVDRLLEADDGKIWASTDGGLAVIDPFSYEIRVLGRAEGAYILTYWDGIGAKTPNGDLLFGGSGGLTVVRPSLVKPWIYQPPIVVTSARIGQVDVPLYRFNNGPSEAPVWIPADQNNLTVEFASLDYTAPERNRYEYKMEGFDHDWIPADPTRRVLRYTNLPPGRFTLLLRGSNRDGVWSPARRINILVLPTWYQKAWFRILAAVVILLCLFGIFLLATAYMRRQQRELERQVALRTAELEQKTVELKQSQQKLEHMAYTDSLTGLPNRRMFTEHFRRLLALKRRQQGTFALLLMDFDDFKSINDTYGHDAGDAVLKEMAVRMSAVVRESDCLARLGGDEYGLVLGQSPDAEATEMVCQKIVESFAEPILFRGAELRTSPSIGVALYPADGKTQDRLYKTADLALYEAKRGGGNSYAWSPGTSPQVQLQ
ncbi:ligand-binding sensor domain-containing diguanylate cyclase [Granulicella aggregans]|nr:ligand-binding sensor domain-containing diguanylate cyclase [Granulicella aggregans]